MCLVFCLVFGSLVSAQETDRVPPLGVVERGNSVFTSFEPLSMDNVMDTTPFQAGPVLFENVDAAVGAAATRGVPEAYRTGCFVWLSALGTTRITFPLERNTVQFWAKNVTEVIPDSAGVLLVTYIDGSLDFIEVQNKGKKNRFRKYVLKDVAQIDVMTNGITNIDDFMYTGKGKE